MLHHRFRSLLVLISVSCAASLIAGTPFVHAQSESTYTAQSIKTPDIPPDELALMVKPLTQAELIAEADAWLELVKAKVRQLSTAEIAIKRKNKEIAAAKESAAAAEDAQEAVERAEATGGESTDDAEKAERLAQEASAAAERIEEAKARTEEDEEVKAAIEEATEEARETNAPTPAPEAAEMSEDDFRDSDRLAASAQTAKVMAEATAEQKENLLDRVNRLREERTALVDRIRVVLDGLDAKGGETETYRQYIKAVSGVDVDASDWDALSATILGWVTSEQGGLRWSLNIAKFVALVVTFWMLSIFVGRVADRALRTRRSRKLSSLMRDFLAKLVRRVVLVIGFVVALTALEINTAPLLAAIGAAGFVVAFALQDSLSNFASGIMILLYRPFDVGDVVETGGVSGKVTALNLVSVTINSFDNKTVLVPNNNVWNDVITNATGVRQRRVDLVFGIGYDDDIDKAQAVLERIVQNHELVLKNPEPVIKLHELADSSVNFICRPWVNTDDYWTVYWDVTRSVKEEFDKEGISIPYPQRDVHMHHVGTQDSGNA